MRPILVLAAVVLAVLFGSSPTAAASWRSPLPGAAVSARFHYDERAPFVRGARRGVDLRGAPGTPVLAACGGTVRYAGPLPRQTTHDVTIVCGRLVATHIGLARVRVAAGRRVHAGSPIGTLGARGVLRLGARVDGRPFAYRDPLRLIEPDTVVPPAGPVAPRGRRGPAVPPAVPEPARVPAATPARASPPFGVLAGLALVAAGLVGGGGGAAVRRRRRRRRPVTVAQRPA